ncbi:DNA polymerase [Klebsiella phage CPRSB]|nr:DNA polymerase [Klebsiella phage CPRSB]
MSAYIKDWKERTPVIVTGWNSDKFDIAYIITRYLNIFGQNVVRHFSPFGKVTARTTTDAYGNEQLGYDISGVAQMDGMALYKKFSFTPQPSYRLDAIAEYETGKNKVEYEGSCLNYASAITNCTSRTTLLTLSAYLISTVNETLLNWFCL